MTEILSAINYNFDTISSSINSKLNISWKLHHIFEENLSRLNKKTVVNMKNELQKHYPCFPILFGISLLIINSSKSSILMTYNPLPTKLIDHLI